MKHNGNRTRERAMERESLLIALSSVTQCHHNPGRWIDRDTRVHWHDGLLPAADIIWLKRTLPPFLCSFVLESILKWTLVECSHSWVHAQPYLNPPGFQQVCWGFYRKKMICSVLELLINLLVNSRWYDQCDLNYLVRSMMKKHHWYIESRALGWTFMFLDGSRA